MLAAGPAVVAVVVVGEGGGAVGFAVEEVAVGITVG